MCRRHRRARARAIARHYPLDRMRRPPAASPPYKHARHHQRTASSMARARHTRSRDRRDDAYVRHAQRPTRGAARRTRDHARARTTPTRSAVRPARRARRGGHRTRADIARRHRQRDPRFTRDVVDAPAPSPGDTTPGMATSSSSPTTSPPHRHIAMARTHPRRSLPAPAPGRRYWPEPAPETITKSYPDVVDILLGLIATLLVMNRSHRGSVLRRIPGRAIGVCRPDQAAGGACLPVTPRRRATCLPTAGVSSSSDRCTNSDLRPTAATSAAP